MNENRETQLVQRVMVHALAGIQEDEHLARRVLTMAQGQKRRVIPGKRLIAVLVVVCLVLTAGVGLAWSVSRDYFSQIAQVTLTSGDYEEWSLEEKQYMASIMGKYGMIGELEAMRLSREDEADIDAFMLARYGFEGQPELSNISIDRIAWVELGPYTDWPNETWVWYCDMMFEIGLWTEKNDVDVYETPGPEAIAPEDAVAIGAAHLIEQGYNPEQVSGAQVIWHYMTHASDVNREHMVYCLTFRFSEGDERYVNLHPDGKII